MAVAIAPAPTLRSVLGTPGVATLFATSILARTPTAATGVVAVLHTRALTGSFAAGGAAAAAYALATGLTAPLLARLVDRLGQAAVLGPGAVLAALALAVFAALPHGTPVVAVLACTVAAGAATPPLGAALRALLPGVLRDPERLHASYAVESSALELTYIAGPLLLAGGVATWSTAAAALACGGLLVGGTLAFLATPASRTWEPGGGTRSHGIAGPLRSAGIRTLLGVLALMGLTFGAVEVAVPAAADAAGHAGAAGALLSVWGLGSMLGGIVAMRIRRPSGPVARLVAVLACFAAGHLALALTGDLVALGALLLLAGMAIAPGFAAAFGLTDRLAPAGTITEAFAWLGTGVLAGVATGSALGGVAAEAGGAQAALLVAGAGGAGAFALAAAARRTLLPR
jgi:MFS family permease